MYPKITKADEIENHPDYQYKDANYDKLSEKCADTNNIVNSHGVLHQENHRPGRKGIIARNIIENDLCFARNEIVPDLIINPNCKPSLLDVLHS